MPAGKILMFAGPSDDMAFRSFAKSIGLTLLHPLCHGKSAEENTRAFDNTTQGGLFSFLPKERLRRHPHPDIGICEVLNPLIRYVRPRYRPPYLVAGQVIWNTDSKAMARQTLPYFMKLRRWVQANWKRREDHYFIGPEAERIAREENAQFAYLPPGLTIKTIPVD